MPIVIIALAFLYTQNIALRASEHGTQLLTKAAVVAEVKADLAKIHPSDKLVYNK